jgi:hypothetical protein
MLAECLNDQGLDSELAMVATSYAFESFVYDLYNGSPNLRGSIPREDIRLWKLIDILKGHKIRRTRLDFEECVNRRDRSVHPWLTPLSPDERGGFIAKVDTLLKLRSKQAL